MAYCLKCIMEHVEKGTIEPLSQAYKTVETFSNVNECKCCKTMHEITYRHYQLDHYLNIKGIFDNIIDVVLIPMQKDIKVLNLKLENLVSKKVKESLCKENSKICTQEKRILNLEKNVLELSAAGEMALKAFDLLEKKFFGLLKKNEIKG